MAERPIQRTFSIPKGTEAWVNPETGKPTRAFYRSLESLHSIISTPESNRIYDSKIVPGGGKPLFLGNLGAGTRVFLAGGAEQWNVSLEPEVYFLADGDSVDFDATFGIPAAIAFDVDGLDIPDWASGESYDLQPTGLDETGFTASLKIATLGAPAAVTESTNATTPAGPAHMVAKADAGAAISGQYAFRVSGTITITQGSYDTGAGPGTGTASAGVVTFSTWFHDGASWVQGPNIVYSIFDPLGSIPAGAHSITLDFGVGYTGTVRSDAADGCFGASHVSGGSITDLVQVSYQKRTSGSPRTASPNGETCRVSVFPRNVAE